MAMRLLEKLIKFIKSKILNIVFCYGVTQDYCGGQIICGSIKEAMDYIQAEIEMLGDDTSSDYKDVKDDYGFDHVPTMEEVCDILAAMKKGEERELLGGYIKINSMEMTRRKLKSLPEFDGC